MANSTFLNWKSYNMSLIVIGKTSEMPTTQVKQ